MLALLYLLDWEDKTKQKHSAELWEAFREIQVWFIKTASNFCVELHLMSSGTVHFFISKIQWEQHNFDCLSVWHCYLPSLPEKDMYFMTDTTVSLCVSCLGLTWYYSWAEASMLRFAGLLSGVCWPSASQLIYPVAVAASHGSQLCLEKQQSWGLGATAVEKSSVLSQGVMGEQGQGRNTRLLEGLLETAARKAPVTFANGTN